MQRQTGNTLNIHGTKENVQLKALYAHTVTNQTTGQQQPGMSSVRAEPEDAFEEERRDINLTVEDGVADEQWIVDSLE
ncbi:hypothetical protein JOB18_009746 [Solea senegalensis]|uniref:Uncharacterized protein n=1 Tax=Solea senegalensis TaxID=28829 RepID=A0AAV6PIL0_SOLSE|nr:hypothetical protein JOB18_009746 [Solea senegalensis]